MSGALLFVAGCVVGAVVMMVVGRWLANRAAEYIIGRWFGW